MVSHGRSRKFLSLQQAFGVCDALHTSGLVVASGCDGTCGWPGKSFPGSPAVPLGVRPAGEAFPQEARKRATGARPRSRGGRAAECTNRPGPHGEPLRRSSPSTARVERPPRRLPVGVRERSILTKRVGCR